jgi:TrmH family RNA methyltransferase
MLHKITSASNPLVKTLKSLHTRKGRLESGLFLAEGARLAAEGAELGFWPEFMVTAPAALERRQSRDLLDRARAAGVKCVETTPAILEQISKRENAQTLISAYRPFPADLARLVPKQSRIFVALEGVRDPGNLGTIWRTADAVGAGGLILIGQTCDPFSVEAVRATMGSLFAVPVVRTEFAAFERWRQAGALELVGASLKARARYDAATVERGTVVLMGNEQSGLPADMEAACDALVKIPMRGRADSLNLAAATAVMLYDVWRRQGYEGAHD